MLDWGAKIYLMHKMAVKKSFNRNLLHRNNILAFRFASVDYIFNSIFVQTIFYA